MCIKILKYCDTTFLISQIYSVYMSVQFPFLFSSQLLVTVKPSANIVRLLLTSFTSTVVMWKIFNCKDFKSYYSPPPPPSTTYTYRLVTTTFCLSTTGARFGLQNKLLPLDWFYLLNCTVSVVKPAL